MPGKKTPQAVYNEALNDAIRGIYRVYGSDLAAFFRDVEDPVIRGETKVELHGHLIQTSRSKRYTINSTR